MYIDHEVKVTGHIPKLVQNLIDEIEKLDTDETWLDYENKYEELYIMAKAFKINDKMSKDQLNKIEERYGAW